MMRRCFLLCLFAVIATGVFSAIYKGQVVDESGAPVSFATVYLLDNPIVGTATASDGSFVLETEESVTKIVVVSFIGYEKLQVRLQDLTEGQKRLVLKEQPIALEETVVSAKPSRQKNKKKQMAQLLYQVYNRMQYDFPSAPYKVRVVSDVKMDAENTPWAMEQMIASVIQIPGGAKNGRDSVQFVGEYCKRFFQSFLRDRADTILAGKKLDKNMRKIAVEMDSGVVVHRSFWAIANVKEDFESEMNDIRNWSVSRENEGETVLTYREHKNYLGIFKYELLRHYIVDSKTYRVRRMSLDGSVQVSIPFGYKLKEGDLELLNMLNMDQQAIEKFRLRRANCKVKLNTIYQQKDGKIIPLERNMVTTANLESTKGKQIPIKVKATQRVTSVQLKGVTPLKYKPSRRVKRENVAIY